MKGLGTLINAAAIIAGGIVGITFKRFIKDNYQETMLKATGFMVMFMGAAGTLSKMLVINNDLTISTIGTMNILISLAFGGLIGEILDIDGHLQKFGIWLRQKSGSEGDNMFIEGFVTSSLTVGIGAMAIMGSISDGIYGDYSILAAKGAIDFVIILAMAASMGKGCAFSSVTVFLVQGSMTLLAALIGNMFTEHMLMYVSMTGGILIFCVGVNLVWEKTIRVANLLPALILTILISMF
ncbi:MAG: DUF554 domain-containing protein [Erysipelotrichaceae bacterium]|nr:DUF554 domain-containing protein [Erysipelotrichaceae bacterium]